MGIRAWFYDRSDVVSGTVIGTSAIVRVAFPKLKVFALGKGNEFPTFRQRVNQLDIADDSASAMLGHFVRVVSRHIHP